MNATHKIGCIPIMKVEDVMVDGKVLEWEFNQVAVGAFPCWGWVNMFGMFVSSWRVEVPGHPISQIENNSRVQFSFR